MFVAVVPAAWAFLLRRIDHVVVSCELAYIRLRRRVSGRG